MDQELKIRNELAELDKKLTDPAIFSDKNYVSLAKRKSLLEETVSLFNQIAKLNKSKISSLSLLESNDLELKQLAEAEIKQLDTKLIKLNDKINDLLTPNDPNDSRDVIMEIRSAAGGDEASLFAAELFRMYGRWAETHNYKLEILSQSPNEIGGFKEIIFNLKGDNAYKNLKFEAGVHRVQRIPTTESQGRVHTSTVTVAVLAQADESDININPADLRIDVYRSSGHGGQSVNTTDSAVRITHLPSGIVVANQDEKSQIKNKAKAMSILRSRLLQRKIEQEQKQLSQARLKLIGSGDRSEKIRTYNFPQDRITDHRINYSRSNIASALAGDIDDLITKLQTAEKELIKIN